MLRRLLTIAVAGAAVFAVAIVVYRSASQGPDPDRWTPLMHAIHHNEASAVGELLAAGADPNVPGKHGETPLMMAAGYGRSELVRMLLEAGADPHAKNALQLNALDMAIIGAADIDRFTVDHCQAATVRELLLHDPDLLPTSGLLNKMALRLKSCFEVERLLDHPPHQPSGEPQPVKLTIHLPGMPEGAKPLDMVLIQPGEFVMGSADPGTGERADWPAHRVTLTQPFYIGVYEVTQAHFETMIHQNRSRHRGSPDLPIERVTWEAAREFVDSLNALGMGRFRLPTEAEWEYAARAGTTTRFFFGDEATDGDAYMWWAGNNASGESKPVGEKLPNPWGLYDVLGNVSEWCADRWAPAEDREPQTDPLGPTRGSRALFLFTNRVYRGGCYECSAEETRSASRSYEQSIDRHYTLGLRVVRDVD